MLEKILSETKNAGIELYVFEGKLRSKGPKDSLSKELASLIKLHRDEVIDYLSSTYSDQENRVTHIAEAETRAVLPLSQAQRRLWFVDQLGEGSAQYNMPGRFRLIGKLDYSAFNKTLHMLIDRHEVLRTYYESQGSEPGQVLNNNYELPLEVIDLSSVGESAKEEALMNLAIEEASLPFDLSKDLMLRVKLVKLSENEHAVLYTMHHIASDGWSMTILQNEFSALYSAFTKGYENPLPPLPLQYSDFALWQSQTLSSDANRESLEYWNEKLKGVKPLDFPTDLPRPASRTYRGGEFEFCIGHDALDKLVEVGKSNGATLYMVLLCIFKILLSRTCGHEDIVVVSPESGRSNSETQSLIGFFVNLVLMRTHINENSDFIEALKQTRATALEAYSNQGVPYDCIISDLRKDLGESATALSRISFTLNNEPSVVNDEGSELVGKLGDLTLQTFDLKNHEVVAKTDLALEFNVSSSGLKGRLVFDKDLFNSTTMEQFCRRYEKLVQNVVSDPAECLNSIDLRLEFDEVKHTSDTYPLSPIQKAVWLDIQAYPEKWSSYNMYEYLNIQGDLKKDCFIEALRHVVSSTTALRMQFHLASDGLLRQSINNDDYTPEYIDFSDRNSPEEQAKEWVEQRRLNPIQPEISRPFCFALLKLSDSHYFWYSHYHHLVVDGICMGFIRQRVASSYNALINKESLPKFEDDKFLRHLQASLEYRYAPGYLADKAYWKSVLAESSSLDLSVKSSGAMSSSPIRVTRSLGDSEIESIRELASSVGVSFGRLMVSIVVLYLEKLSETDSLTIGVQTHGRFDKRFRSSVVPCSNVLPISFKNERTGTFRDFLDHANSQMSEAFSHGNFRYEEILTSLGRKPSDAGVYDITLNVLSNRSEVRLTGSSSCLHSFPRYEDNLVIRVYFSENGSDVHFYLDGNALLYSEWELQTHADRLTEFVESLAKSPQHDASAIDLAGMSALQEIEKDRILNDWTESEEGSLHQHCIHTLFEERVDQFPQKIAVEHTGRSITYRDLNEKANRLANLLIDRGVKPDCLIGLFMERSIEMVVAVLGILKSGAAYVPIDPDYPSNRIAHIIEDSEVGLIISQSAIRDRISNDDLQIICLDSDSGSSENLLSNQSHANPEIDAIGLTARNLAYVIYTSGSTGKPKGVMLEHRQVSNFMDTVQKLYGWNHNDRVLQFATINFDISVEEIFGALTTGATLVLRTDEWLTTPEKFWNLCATHNITIVDLSTAYWQQIVPESRQCIPRHVKQVMFSGEKVNPEVISQWFALGDKLPQLINAYGPTETTVTSTYLILDEGSVTSSIGGPVANTSLYVLDSSLNPVPVGSVGELHIGGMGLARGYLNRDELTESKFIRDPFHEDSNAKLYKTGDLVRWLPEGEIEFLGRIDNQVKIRGFRVELGEIESQLMQHGIVKSCAVVVIESTKQLVAYIVLNDNYSSGETGGFQSVLREYLQRVVPEYMVPSGFIAIDKIPLTINGKLDTRALPEPNAGSFARDQYKAAVTEVEKALTRIWSEILYLPVEDISITDNFFALGGHSLLATRLVNLVQDYSGKCISLQNVFEGPTIAELSQLVEEKPLDQTAQIVSVSRDNNLELSFAQQRLWFLSKLEGTSANYNIPMALRLQGKLDKQALISSLRTLVERHEVLRTRFVETEGSAYQLIDDTVDFQVAEQSLADESLLTSLCEEEALIPFDLSSDQLVRARLLGLADGDHVLLITMHHSVSDGWSMGIFFDELVTLYRSYCEGAPSPLVPLEVQYADFSHWQRQWLSGDVMDSLLSYWKEQLTGLPPLLELPTDRPRPSVQTYKGARKGLHFSPALLQGLNTLGQAQGTTLYMTLLAGFSVLLGRYSNQTDIAVGSPIANRNRPELERLIGFFVNTLVMRTDVSGEPVFLDLLAQVKETALAAYAHQDIPFEYLVEALEPERNMSYSPLFQVMFVLQNIPSPDVQFPDLTISPVEIGFDITKFDLTLNLQETDEGLQGSIEYNTDLFDEATIERFIQHYERLLQGIVEDPARRVSEYRLLSDEELQQQLVEWNDTGREYPSEKCIHELIAEQVAKTPDSIAVEHEGETLTYRALDEQSNRIAHYLRSEGVGPETLVGICIDRSIDMVVGLLGILKAGGAYVPIDPAYPEQRISYILEDSGVELVLSHSALAKTIPEGGHKSVYLDTDTDSEGNEGLMVDQTTEGLKPEELGLTASNLAYIIYTSGSTGNPKGVMIEHRQLVNFMGTVTSLYNWSSTDRVVQFATLNFDISVEEIFGSLVTGATLILRTDEWLSSPTVFWKLASQNAITVLDLSTAFWEQVVPESASDIPASVRQVIFSGEKVSAEKVKEWFALEGKLPELINAYGPTETTVTSTYLVVDKESSVSSIGKPVVNTQAYIVDGNNQQVPVGVVGELILGGDGVARGYLKNEELSNKKFFRDPLLTQNARKVYRTGDLVRWLNNGQIEFIGRVDNQVKIRGYRIELDEISNQLMQHVSVKSCAVIVREDMASEKSIVAYVVLREKEKALLSKNLQATLKKYLQEFLPDFMMPACFVELDSMPLTTNNKLDVKALPKPVGDFLHQEEFVPATTESETILAGVWSELFGLDQDKVSVTSNFFELGGHSLLAIRMSSLIGKKFEIELPVIDIFQFPTIEKLAENIDEKILFGTASNNAIRLKSGSSTPLFFVHHPGGYVWNYVPLVESLSPDQCAYGLQYSNRSDDELSKLSVEAVARLHVDSILKVQPEGPYRLIGHSGGGQLAYEIAYQLLGRNKTVEFVGMIDTYNFSQLEVPDQSKGTAQVALGFLQTIVLQHTPDIDDELLDELFDGRNQSELPEIFEYLLDLKLIPAGYDYESLLQQSKFFFAMDRACVQYVPPPLPTNIYLYSAARQDSNFKLGWDTHADEQWHIREIGGDHKTILEAPHLRLLAKTIEEDLTEVERSAPRSDTEAGLLHRITYSGKDCENIFCIPGAGGNSSSFIPLADALSAKYNLFGTHYRGLGEGGVPFSNMQVMAAEYVTAIRKASPEGPYRLVGHSFGGLVAIEVARQLEALGESVKPVIMLDTDIKRQDRTVMQGLDRAEKFMELVDIFEQLTETDYGLSIENFRNSSASEQLNLLKQKMEWSGAIARTNTTKDIECMVRVFFSQLDILYSPDTPFSGQLILLVPGFDPTPECVDKALRGWSRYSANVEIRSISGNHMTLLQQPEINSTVTHMNSCWDDHGHNGGEYEDGK